MKSGVYMEITEAIAINLKTDFPLLSSSNIVYLDSAASAQKPKSVLNAMDMFARQKYAPVHRGLYPFSVNATQDFEMARKNVAQFINARDSEIIFTAGTTASLNGLARSIASILSSGVASDKKKKILLTEMEHHANLVPWQQMAKREGYMLDFIPLTKKFTLDLSIVQAKLSAGDVALVCVTHASNVLGTINPVKEICALAKAAGAITVIDGAQAVAHFPVDVKSLDCDFYAFSGHKLYGPTGVGVLYGRYELLERLPPFTFGGHMIETVTKYDATWAAIPARFEAGTPPIVEVIGLSAAVKYLSEIGLSDIYSYESDLVAYARVQLAKIEGITIFAGELNCGIISFVVEGMHAHDIASLLGDSKVCVRAGHHCAMPLTQVLGVPSTVRLSFGLFNTTADVDALIIALKRAQSLFSNHNHK